MVEVYSVIYGLPKEENQLQYTFYSIAGHISPVGKNSI